MPLSRRFLIRVNVGGDKPFPDTSLKPFFEKSSKDEMKRLFKYIQDEMNARVKNVQNASMITSKPLGQGPSFDESMKNFATYVFKKIQNRFYHNPPHWPALSYVATKMREYRKNPDLLREEILANWMVGNFPDFNFRSRPLDPAMQPSSPALLQTGSLSRSVKVSYIVQNGPVHLGNDRWTYRHARKVVIKARPLPYSKIQFEGGSTDIYYLSSVYEENYVTPKGKHAKRKKEKSIFFPQAYLNEMKSKEDELKRAGYQLAITTIDIPARNPLYFEQEDADMVTVLLGDLGRDVESNIVNAFQKDPASSPPKSTSHQSNFGNEEDGMPW